MGYEKKYKEALEKARQLCAYPTTKPFISDLQDLFPELKESEDEMIRKALIYHYQGDGCLCTNEYRIDYKEIRAWLEKQGAYSQREECLDCQFNYASECKGSCAMKRGEQKPVVIISKFRIGDEIKTSNEESLTITKIDEKGYWSEDLFICSFDEECIWDLVKQKPIDKAEPKFHKGEWIIHQGTENIYQVVALIDNHYQLKYGDNYAVQKCTDVDRYARLWDIKDAKCGDVLSDGTTIFIFKDLLSDGSVMSYCDYDTDSGESDAFCPLSMNLMCSKITPATKEQRDILMKAIADAGYTFDFKKKELKRIEQKPAWSEEDNSNLQCCITKVQHDMNNGWIGRNEELLSWLESLKDRYTWKPSDEQMITLRQVISGCSYDIEPLVELETKLKEL
jgi:hypothetical protein